MIKNLPQIFLGKPEKPVIVSHSSVVTLSTSHKSKLGLPAVLCDDQVSSTDNIGNSRNKTYLPL